MNQQGIVYPAEQHYRQDNLYHKIITAFAERGKREETLTFEGFSTLNELHTMGRQGTQLLANVGDIQTGDQILDSGYELSNFFRSTPRTSYIGGLDSETLR